ncbi:MAG: C40 family peptidase [Bacilli bacterium]|nr:C40 family peptidase [Bacilli bacterium]
MSTIKSINPNAVSFSKDGSSKKSFSASELISESINNPSIIKHVVKNPTTGNFDVVSEEVDLLSNDSADIVSDARDLQATSFQYIKQLDDEKTQTVYRQVIKDLGNGSNLSLTYIDGGKVVVKSERSDGTFDLIYTDGEKTIIRTFNANNVQINYKEKNAQGEDIYINPVLPNVDDITIFDSNGEYKEPLKSYFSSDAMMTNVDSDTVLNMMDKINQYPQFFADKFTYVNDASTDLYTIVAGNKKGQSSRVYAYNQDGIVAITPITEGEEINNIEGEGHVVLITFEDGKIKDYKIQENGMLKDVRGDVVKAALGYINVPYVWGGEMYDNDNRGNNGEVGVDCSGLVKMAYKENGIDVPHQTGAIFNSNLFAHVDSVEKLQPGDLIQFGGSGKNGHVGIYLGENEQGVKQVIHAPTFNNPVRVDTLEAFNNHSSSMGPNPNYLHYTL